MQKEDQQYLPHLGDEQEAAFNHLADAGLFDPQENKAFTLTGAAGTGKTFLTQAIIEHCLTEGIPVAATATTNQAANVLEGHLPGSVSVTTIHSLLGLTMKPDFDTGKMKLVKDKDKPLTLPDGGIVLVDEASMESTRLVREIEKERAKRHINFLHIGDAAQLPPVENVDKDAPQFPGLQFPGVELETIHRQAKDNPIITAATAARFGMEYLNYCQIKDGKGVALYSDDQILKSATARFESDAYDEDPLHARILAARNRVVRRWNRRITQEIYGTDKKFHEDMWVISMDAWTPHDQIILYTSQLLKIEELTKRELNLKPQNIPWKGQIWDMKVRTQNGRIIPGVKVLAKDDRKAYEKVQDEFREEALAGERWKWRKFFEMKNELADIEPAYASTIHKAQGTSIKYVYMMESDIRTFPKDPDFDVRQALRYVAVSRGENAVAIHR